MTRRMTSKPQRRSTGPQPIPPRTEVHPMQPQQPQIPPMTDSALALLWKPHATELAEAQKCAQQAEPHERSAEERSELARQKRASADAKRAEAALLDDQAAELEALATADTKAAKRHRQDQQHHEDNATTIALTVQFHAATNGLVHPEERDRRAKQAAAANGQAPVANGVLETQPFRVSAEVAQ